MSKKENKEKPIAEGLVLGCASILTALIIFVDKDTSIDLLFSLVIILGLFGLGILFLVGIWQFSEYRNMNEFVIGHFETFRAWLTFGSLLLIPISFAGIIFFIVNLNKLKLSLIKPELDIEIYYDSFDKRFEFSINNNSEVVADKVKGIARLLRIDNDKKITPMKFTTDFLISGDGTNGVFNFTEEKENNPITKGMLIFGCQNCEQSFYYFSFSKEDMKDSYYVKTEKYHKGIVTKKVIDQTLKSGEKIFIKIANRD